MTIKDIKASFENMAWLSDKLAYWSSHDISELDDSYGYSSHWLQIQEGIERLESFQRTLKARIDMNKSITKNDIVDEITLAQLDAENELCNLLLALLEGDEELEKENTQSEI